MLILFFYTPTSSSMLTLLCAKTLVNISITALKTTKNVTSCSSPIYILTGHTWSVHSTVFAKEKHLLLKPESKQGQVNSSSLKKEKIYMLYDLSRSWKRYLLAKWYVSYRLKSSVKNYQLKPHAFSQAQSQAAPTEVWKQCNEWA